MSRRGRPKAQAKAKVAPTPPAMLPRTTQPAQPAQRAEVPQSTQPPPSNWNRAAFTWILIAIIAPRAIPLSPASAFRCLNHVSAFYAEAGMGKSTVAAAVLRELHDQNVVQQYKERCSGVIVHELDNTPLPSAGKSTEPKPVWVRELRKDGSRLELVGNAFQVKEKELQTIDDLKKAIEREEELTIPASRIDIYRQEEDGSWKEQSKMSGKLHHNDEDSLYGYFLP
eukprot:symbB.v1.2.041187.t1/scaffold7906.1/size8772/1